MVAELQINLQATSPHRPHALDVSVEFDGVARTRSPFSLLPLMECFRRFGAQGGFAGARFRPETSRLHLQNHDLGNGQGHWSFDEFDCAPETLGVLARVLRYSHCNVNSLKRAAITSGLRLFDGMPRSLRGCTTALAFEISLERDAKDVLLTVELCNRPDIMHDPFESHVPFD